MQDETFLALLEQCARGALTLNRLKAEVARIGRRIARSRMAIAHSRQLLARPVVGADLATGQPSPWPSDQEGRSTAFEAEGGASPPADSLSRHVSIDRLDDPGEDPSAIAGAPRAQPEDGPAARRGRPRDGVGRSEAHGTPAPAARPPRRRFVGTGAGSTPGTRGDPATSPQWPDRPSGSRLKGS